MSEREVKKLKVGSRIRGSLGDILEVVSIRRNQLYELKWVDKNGNLSEGSLFKVSSHFERDKLVRL